jgi:hypothetical protein
MYKPKYIREELERMDVAKELLTIRYLLSVILSNLYRMNSCSIDNFENLFDLLQPRVEKTTEKKTEKKVPLASPQRKEIRKEKKRVKVVEQIQFEKFSIKATQYEALVKEYGVDIVTEACVLLDGYLIQTNRDIKDSYKKLKEWAIHQVTKKRLNDIRRDINIITTEVDYESIEDDITARKYIASVPNHRRNIDPAVKYLVNKFNIKE